MEIQYKMFNKWINDCESLNDSSLHEVFGSSTLISFVNGFNTVLSKNQNALINEARVTTLEWKRRQDILFPKVVKEIDKNIISIENDKVLQKYLSYILKKNSETHTRIKMMFNHKELGGAITKDAIPGGDIIVNGVVKGRAVEQRSDPISMLLSQSNCVFKVERLSRMIYLRLHKDRRISKEAPIIVEHELEKVAHRLLLLHKSGAFEILIKLHYNHLSSVRFARLIATIMGIPDASFNGFRGEVIKLVSEIQNPKRPKSIQNDTANKKVNAYLAELGIINSI